MRRKPSGAVSNSLFVIYTSSSQIKPPFHAGRYAKIVRAAKTKAKNQARPRLEVMSLGILRSIAVLNAIRGDAVQRKSFSCKLSFSIGETAFVAHKIDNQSKALRFGWCVLAAIVLGLVIAIRIRLLGIPLERDEGEYAYAGQFMLQGIPPYKLAYNMKFPGTYAGYALIMAIFGQSIVGVHLGLPLINAATILLIFLLGRRLINSIAGLAAAMAYAILSVNPSVVGFAAHVEHFVMLPALGGMLLLLNESDRRNFERLFISGLLFGTSLLMKQPAVFFILFGG